jgi:putative membrane protein
MQMRHLPLWLGLALPLAACGTKAVTPLPEAQILTGEKLNQADANFVTTAYQITQLDNQQGQIAAAQASSQRVRAIAGELVAKANALYPELEAAIKRNGILPPTRLPEDLAARVDRLRRLQGEAFDDAYLADQVKSHKRAVAVFQEELSRTQDPAMHALAARALPIVQNDLAQLLAISAAVK